jgi:hypothetical protein
MKTLKSPNGDYLLPSSLDSLFMECKEWLDELSFWKGEQSFYIKLIKRQQEAIPEKEVVLHVLSNLQMMQGELISELHHVCELHRSRMSLLESEKADDEAFRLEHARLAEKYYNFKSDYYALKFKVFNLMK